MGEEVGLVAIRRERGIPVSLERVLTELLNEVVTPKLLQGLTEGYFVSGFKKQSVETIFDPVSSCRSARDDARDTRRQALENDQGRGFMPP